MTTALATLNDRQTNYENVADQVDAAEEEALLNPVIDAADAAIDDDEEKFDDIDSTPKPTPEVQSRLHTQEVENAYSHADSVVLGLQTHRTGVPDSEFDAKDCAHVKSELDLLNKHITSVIQPAVNMLVEYTSLDSRADASKSQSDPSSKVERKYCYSQSCSRASKPIIIYTNSWITTYQSCSV